MQVNFWSLFSEDGGDGGSGLTMGCPKGIRLARSGSDLGMG